jgi:hypothetical protein
MNDGSVLEVRHGTLTIDAETRGALHDRQRHNRPDLAGKDTP